MKPTGLVLGLFLMISGSFAATATKREPGLKESRAQAAAYLRAEKINDAISALAQGIQDARESGLQNDDLGGALSDLGILYQNTGRPAEAERAYTEAIRVLKDSDSDESRQALVVVVRNFAALRLRQGRYTEAERLYREAEKVVPSLSDGPEYLACIWSELADTYLSAGRYLEAAELAERSVRLLEANGQQAKAGAPLFILASIAWHKREVAETEKYLRRAIAAWEEFLGPEHPTYMAGLGCLAAVLSRSRPDAAEQLFRKALDTLEAKLGGQHTVLAGVLMLYSQHLKAHGRKTEGKDLQRRAELIYAKYGLPNRGQTVDIMMLRR